MNECENVLKHCKHIANKLPMQCNKQNKAKNSKQTRKTYTLGLKQQNTCIQHNTILTRKELNVYLLLIIIFIQRFFLERSFTIINHQQSCLQMQGHTGNIWKTPYQIRNAIGLTIFFSIFILQTKQWKLLSNLCKLISAYSGKLCITILILIIS